MHQRTNAAWSRIEDWLSEHSSELGQPLRAGATDAELQALEEAIRVRLPDDIRASYLRHDGQEWGAAGIFFGWEWLSLGHLKSNWMTWADIRRDKDMWTELEEYAIENGASSPEGAIRLGYTNERWIPVLHDGCGNHIGLDFDPGPKGTAGQVISFGRDTDHKLQVALSFVEFLERFAAELEGGNFVLEPQEDAGVRFGPKTRPSYWPR